MPVRYLILPLFMAALCACGPSSQTRPDNAAQIAEREVQALSLIDQGDFSAAGEEYLALAASDPGNAAIYRLKAAGAFYEAGELSRASDILATVETAAGSQTQLQKNILTARIALNQGDAKGALDVLGPPPEAGTAVNLASAYHEIRASAYAQLGRDRDAIDDRLLLARMPLSTAEIAANDQSLWTLLTQLDSADLETMQASSAGMALGWIELALINRVHFSNPVNLKAVIGDWSARYPQHSAQVNIVPGLIESSENFSARPQQIAVLLPMSGRFRDASRAIREGLVAAWFDDRNNPASVSFVNTDSLNVVENYQQAVADGADFIIGPLEKPAIERLLEQGTLSKKTLVLNYFDGNLDDPLYEHVQPGKNFFQFALAPESEAEQVAERAFQDGHVRALVITAGGEWGDRMLLAFEKRWLELGGVMLERASYSDATEDYSEPIRQLLNTDSSKLRAKELRAVLNRSIHSEERRRQDADFIFIAARPEIARQVMPHIRFLRAGDLPVYATSHIYSGQPNPVRDADMNNILFADIPWNLNPDFAHGQSKSVIGQSWPQLAANYQRLYALGYDAYAVIPELPALRADVRRRFNGATGDLYIVDQGRIQRKLTWARFVDGQPEVGIDTGL